MSIANLNSNTLFGVQNIYANDITCDVINAGVVGIENLTVQNITGTTAQFGSLNLTQAPATDNANTNVLVYDSISGNIELNTTLTPGSSLLPLNNVWTGNNSYKNPITIGGDYGTFIQGAIHLSDTQLNTTTITTGTVTQIPMEIVTTTGRRVLLNNPTADDNFTLNNFAQTLTNKTLTQPIIGTILNPNNANLDVSLPSTSGGDEFITTFATQDLINKNINAELGGGFYSNTGANRFLRFNISGALNNTATTLRFNQTANRSITFPDSTGTVALTSGVVDLTTNQTIAGTKTFSNAPVISTISNTGVITVPTTTGTLALTSQIPNNTSYVDLTTNQTINGIKTFTLSPIFNGPTNQTFPTYIPVGIHNTNKDLQAITNMASIDTVQTFINKTISTLTATGTTQSLLSGKQLTNYISLTTINNTPTNVFTLPMVANQTLTLEVDMTAFCTAGPDLDKVRGFSSVYLVKRTSLGVMASYTVSSSIAGDGGYSPNISITLGPGSFSLQFTGLTGDTINLGGNYCINYR